MDPIERLFEGVDLVTPFRVIEEIGLRPDDTLVTRPKTNLKRLVLDRADRRGRTRTLQIALTHYGCAMTAVTLYELEAMAAPFASAHP
jgi:hypothetical protein